MVEDLFGGEAVRDVASEHFDDEVLGLGGHGLPDAVAHHDGGLQDLVDHFPLAAAVEGQAPSEEQV